VAVQEKNKPHFSEKIQFYAPLLFSFSWLRWLLSFTERAIPHSGLFFALRNKPQMSALHVEFTLSNPYIVLLSQGVHYLYAAKKQ